MPSNFYSPEGHDFAHTLDAHKLAAENQAAMERKFQEDLTIFRADVFRKLHAHGALHDGEGWAIFMPEPKIDDNRGLQFNNRRDLLVVTGVDLSTQKHLIRIVANEIFVSGTHLAVMAEDFVADTEDDTQYFIDAVDVEPEYNTDTYAPTFNASSNEYVDLTNFYLTFVPVVGISGKPAIHQEIAPFGHYTNLEDKIHALNVGKGLLAEVMTTDPVYAKTSSS